MVIGCGSLSQVNDDDQHSKAVRSPRRGSTLNRQSRKSRIKTRFKNAFSKRPTEDPLSLVGSELLVREYPLAVMEQYRGGNGKSTGAGLSPRPRRQRNRRSPKRKDQMRDDGEERRLLHLQNIVRQSTDGSISEGTIASVGSRGGLDASEAMSTSSSHISIHSTQQSIHNAKNHHAQHVRRKVIRKIHGKTRYSPLCPTCSGNLTYRYISKRKQHISIRDIHYGNESTKQKLQNLLPPLCKKCETHLLFEHSECKPLMMENFDTWLESGFDDDSDVEERRRQDKEKGHDYCNFNDPLNAKIMVVDRTPKKVDTSNNMTVHVAAPPLTFGDPRIDQYDDTPRLSNSSRDSGETESSSSRFEFDDADAAMENPVFSGVSELSDRTNRRKGQLQYEQIIKSPNDDNDVQQQSQNNQVSDENRQEEGATATPFGEVVLPAHESKTDSSEVSSACYCSDDDPFVELHEDDDKGGGCSADNDQQKDGQDVKKIEDMTPAIVPVDQSLSNNTSGSIMVIHTESEERTILESYSLTKDVATVQIAQELIRGHELTTSKCDRCQMPMMKINGGTLECVACPAIHQKAKQIAMEKRETIKSTIKCDGQRESSSMDVDDNGVSISDPSTENGGSEDKDVSSWDATTEEGDKTDKSAHSLTYDIIYAALEEKDEIDQNMQIFSHGQLSKDSVSLAILEETQGHWNALEEGRLGYTCSDENGPFRFLGDCEGINYGPGGKPSAEHSSSSSIYLNPNVTKHQIGRYSMTYSQSDYWVHHSSSHNGNSWHSDEPSSYSHSTQHYPAVEHSLSSYQENVGRLHCLPNVTTEVGEHPSFHSSGNRILGSISEVSEPRQIDHRQSNNHSIASLAEVSEHHETSSHNPSSETIIHQNQSKAAAEDDRQMEHSCSNQSSSSDGSEYGNSSPRPHALSTGEASTQQHQPNMTAEDQSLASDLAHREGHSSNTATDAEQLCHSHSSDQSETRCPRNLPLTEMIHSQYHPIETAGIKLPLYHGLNSEHEGSVSEVSVSQGSFEGSIRCSSSELTHRQYQPNVTTNAEQLHRSQRNHFFEGSLSEVSDTQCPRNLPSSEMIIQKNQADIRTENGLSTQPDGSISEVSVLECSTELSRRPSTELTRCQHQSNLTIDATHLHHSLSDHHEGSTIISPTRCPRNLAHNEMMHHPEVAGEMKMKVDHAPNSPLEGSLSEVTKSQGYSDVSSTHFPRSLAPNEMVYPQDQVNSTTATGTQLYPSHISQYQQSLSEVSMREKSSAESSTKCPRNVSSNEMIWSYESHNGDSQPEQVYTVQNITSEHRVENLAHLDQACGAKVNKDEVEESRIHPRQALHEHTRSGMQPCDKNRHYGQADSWQDQAQDVKCCDPQKASSENVSNGFEERGHGNFPTAMCNGASDDSTIIPSKQFCEIPRHSPLMATGENGGDRNNQNNGISANHDSSLGLRVISERNKTGQTLSCSRVVARHTRGNCSTMPSESIQTQVPSTFEDNKLPNDGECLAGDAQNYNHKKLSPLVASLSNMHRPSEISLAAQASEGWEWDEQLKDDFPQDTIRESLSDKIARLADSLREVANRLPLEEDDHRRDIETENQYHDKMPSKMKDECLNEGKQPCSAANSRNFILPSVHDMLKKIRRTQNEADQYDRGQIHTMYPYHQTKEELPAQDKGKLKKSSVDRYHDRVPSKENENPPKENETCLAKEMLEHQTPPEHSNIEEKIELNQVLGRTHPSPQTDNQITANGNDQIEVESETIKIYENEGCTNSVHALHENNSLLHGGNVHPLFSPMKEDVSPYNHNIPTNGGVKWQASLSSVVATENVQRPVRFLHEAHTLSPMHSLRSNSFGAQMKMSPINVRRNEEHNLSNDCGESQIHPPSIEKPRSDSKQRMTSPRHNHTSPRKQRSDPPICRDQEHNLSNDCGESQIHPPSGGKIHSDSKQRVTSPRYNHTSPRKQRSDPPVRRDEDRNPPNRRKIHSDSKQRMSSPRYNHTSPRKQRSDPPGRRMEPSGSDIRDPPGTPIVSRSKRRNATPIKKQMPSLNIKTPYHDDSEAMNSRGSDTRDPTPNNSAEKPHPAPSVCIGITPSSERRRLCAKDDNSSHESPNWQRSHASREETEQEQDHTIALREEHQQQNKQLRNQEEQQLLQEERERGQQHYEALQEEGKREKTSRIQEEQRHVLEEREEEKRLLQEEREREQQRHAQEETSRIQEEQRHLLEGREEEKRLLQEERELEEQHLQVLRKEQERQQHHALEETSRIQEEQRRLQEEREEEKRLLQEEREREERRLQVLREERERQQRHAQEETSRIQEEQRRLREEREEEKRLLLEEGKREQRRLQDLREERQQQQRTSLEETSRIQEEQRRLQEEREEEKRLLREEGEREQRRLQDLREERQRQQHIAQEETRRILEEHRRLQEEREEEKRLLWEEREREQQRLQALREERQRRQRHAQEEARRNQEEQQRLQEEKRLREEEGEREQQRLQALREDREQRQRIVQEDARRIQEDRRRPQEEREEEKRLLGQERTQQRLEDFREEREGVTRERQQHIAQKEAYYRREEPQCLPKEWERKQQSIPHEYLADGSNARTIKRQPKQYISAVSSNGLNAPANKHKNKIRENQGGQKAGSDSRDQSQISNAPSCEIDRATAPIQRKSSWGENSLNDLFRQIDEIEDDFHTIVASLPGSEGRSSASSENGSLKSSGDDNLSLVEITLNNAGSFESNSSGDSMVTDVMQRMRRIKDYMEQIDSVDDNDGDRSIGSYDSQGEMSQLILRLTNAAAELRTFHEWDN